VGGGRTVTATSSTSQPDRVLHGQAVEPVGRRGGRPAAGAEGGAGDRHGDQRPGRGLLRPGLREFVVVVLVVVGDGHRDRAYAALVLPPGLLLAVAAFA
jgi:hypothetical protein